MFGFSGGEGCSARIERGVRGEAAALRGWTWCVGPRVEAATIGISNICNGDYGCKIDSYFSTVFQFNAKIIFLLLSYMFDFLFGFGLHFWASCFILYFFIDNEFDLCIFVFVLLVVDWHCFAAKENGGS